MKRRLFTIVLIALWILAGISGVLPGTSYAEESVGDYAGFYADDSRLTSLERIHVPFYIFKGHIYEYDFPYTDDFFRYPSDQFSKIMAQASLGLAVSAFRNDNIDLENQYETYLSGAGFSDIDSFGYDQPTSPETLSGVIAHKAIDDFTLIACAPCGQGYGKEWGSNFNVGDGEDHAGFRLAADILEEQLAAYREQYQIEGKIKVWITGFSRASAVANLTAADLVDSEDYEDVYAYLFGVPNTTKNSSAGEYKGIYNICGQYDPVTSFPLQSWGFTRYGTELFTPSQEADTNYAIMAPNASIVHFDISRDFFRNNPEINHQFHMIIEFLAEMFPTSEEYVQDLQDAVMRIWTEPDAENIPVILMRIAQALQDLDEREAYAQTIFLNYILYIASEHLEGNQRQVEEGSWDPNALMAENMLREHQPLTYIAWAFSDNDVTELYSLADMTRQLIILADVDVQVLYRDQLVEAIDRKGAVTTPERDETLPQVFMMRDGERITIELPLDSDFTIALITDKEQLMMYRENYYLTGIQSGFSMYNYGYEITPGTYRLTMQNPGSELTPVSGEITDSFQMETEYSPMNVMLGEYAENPHLTVDYLLDFFRYLFGGLALLGLASLVIAVVHKIRKRRGHPRYSDWWVIIPHLLLIAAVLLISLFVVHHLPIITFAVSTGAAATVFMVFLLAVRAYVRNRKRRNLVVMAGLFVLTILAFFFYRYTPVASYSMRNVVITSVVVALLSALAARGFFVNPDLQRKFRRSAEKLSL